MRGFHLKAWRGFATCPSPTPATSGGIVIALFMYLYNRVLLARRSGRFASRYAHAPHSTPGMGESLPGTMGRQLPLRGRFTSFLALYFRFAEGRVPSMSEFASGTMDRPLPLRGRQTIALRASSEVTGIRAKFGKNLSNPPEECVCVCMCVCVCVCVYVCVYVCVCVCVCECEYVNV